MSEQEELFGVNLRTEPRSKLDRIKLFLSKPVKHKARDVVGSSQDHTPVDTMTPTHNINVLLRSVIMSNPVKQDGNGVQCRICNKTLYHVNTSHLRTHGLTLKQYRQRFPGARTVVFTEPHADDPQVQHFWATVRARDRKEKSGVDT